MELVGEDVEEINVIENHGTVKVHTTGHHTNWITVYQNYGEVIDNTHVENVILFNSWPGSLTKLGKVTG